MKTLLAIGIGILFVPWLASAEDFIWQGKKYIDVRVISIDKKKMVGLSSKKKGNFKVPYNRLSWTLKKEADIVVKKQKEELLKEGEKFFGARPEEPASGSDNASAPAEPVEGELPKPKTSKRDSSEFIGRRYIHGTVFRVFSEGVVVEFSPTLAGLPKGTAAIVRGKAFLSNHPDQENLIDGDEVSVEVWSVGRKMVDAGDFGKLAFKGYDMKPPVLIEEREWKDYKNRKITASVAAVGEGKIVFVADGKVITLPKEKVNIVDRKFIELRLKKGKK